MPGPLVEAMRTGGFLHGEELDRTPEDTIDTLLTATDQRRIAVPRVGTVEAGPAGGLPAPRHAPAAPPARAAHRAAGAVPALRGWGGWPLVGDDGRAGRADRARRPRRRQPRRPGHPAARPGDRPPAVRPAPAARPPRPPGSRGAGEPASVPWRGGSDDLDPGADPRRGGRRAGARRRGRRRARAVAAPPLGRRRVRVGAGRAGPDDGGHGGRARR
ncbi:AAA family ATPase [Geodermatophilus dictyosporus]|uniref:AAA family ATPase n=1 Tax=Geodermatophilus dictyosporus TaxID=1523247 RepID=UPI00145C329A